MSTDAQSPGTSPEPHSSSPVNPDHGEGETVGQAMRRLDEAEDQLKGQAAEAKEKTEEAGHRLAGPLDE